MKYGALFREGCKQLETAGIDEAKLDARLLLEFVCGTNRNDLLAHGDRQVSDEEEARYREVLELRAGRIPLQQITHSQDFMGLDFFVNEHVLVPRQDTEILVEEVLKELHDGMRILDMCTGSGCILISLMHYSNDCEGVGADISPDALQVANRNRSLLPEHKKLSFIQSDLFEHVEGRFDVIVSNPPYIAPAEYETLMPEVKEHEPRIALVAEEDGLAFYHRMIQESPKYLYGGGMLFFEIGSAQAEGVCGLLEESGFTDIHVVKDYAGLDRVVYGTRM